MRVNVYYGGRGLIDDPTLFILSKIEKVLDELHVNVERYNLYEDKGNISVLPKTLKGVDGVILATSVEWLGMGWLMQHFLDSCWLYGDKEQIREIRMMSVVTSSTYGERQVDNSLVHAWEMLGGIPSEEICSYVDNHIEFETNAKYNFLIERKTENFYRDMAKKVVSFPSSCQQVKKNVLKSRSITLTPQESEQLSEYNSNDTYVKKQKEDIEELASLFNGMLGGEEKTEKYVRELKKSFTPFDDLSANFQIDVLDENLSIIVNVDKDNLACYHGKNTHADVTVRTKSAVMEKIIGGELTFQGAFMSGELSASGNFKILRNFDTIFRFTK